MLFRSLKGTQGTPTILKESFLSQQSQLVEKPQSSTPFGCQVFMMNGSTSISIATQSKDYTESRQVARKEIVDGPSPPPPSGPLQIERPNTEPVVQLPSKGVLHKSSYNPNAPAAQHYNIVEDFAQAPSPMSALEFLQSFPSQRKDLLFVIGGVDPADLSLITFDLENFVPRLPHHLALIIQVGINGMNIHRAIVDEGESTCIMSSAY